MLLTTIVFLVVLSILVFVHEFGHFLAAKKFGIRVEEFGFGLPPRIFGIERGKTIYSVNWLPIGGFVKLYGEEMEESSKLQAPNSKSKDAFFAKSKKVRAAVLLAGVVMNFLLAVVLISYIFTKGVMVPGDKILIKEVTASSPAQIAGLKENDQVLSVGGRLVKNTQEFVEITKSNVDKEIAIEVFRKVDNPCALGEKVLGAYPGIKISCHGENMVTLLTPRVSPPKGEGPIGVAVSNLEERKYPWWRAPFLGMLESLKLSALMFLAIGGILLKLITFQPIGAEITGPLGIAQVTGEAVKFGVIAVLQLIGLLSLNLAVINILPFPALDGGRLLFVGIEAVTGKKVKPRWERWTHQVGMAVLLTLIVLVTINDLLRILGR